MTHEIRNARFLNQRNILEFLLPESFSSMPIFPVSVSRSVFLSVMSIIRKLLFVFLLNFLSTNTLADYTIAAGTTVDAASLIGQTGALTINGTLNISTNTFLSFSSVIVHGPSGQIYWLNNSDLTFNQGTVITVDSTSAGLQPNKGNGSQRLIVGSVIIAVSSLNANDAIFSFDQINLLGGLPKYILTTNSPVCLGNPVSVSIAPDKIVAGVTNSYQWSISPAAGSFSYNSGRTAATIALAPGSYTITCIATANTFNTTLTLNVKVNVDNTWLGVNSNWADPANWCPAVPTSSSSVTIPSVTNNPTISAGTTATVKAISIASGAMLTVKGTLQIGSTLTSNGMVNAGNGTIEMNGSAAQSIAGSMFYNKTIQNLVVSNTGSGLTVSSAAQDTLKISGSLTFGNTSSILNTGDNIDLLSNAAGTARLGIVGAGNSINGNVIVDRYINVGTAPGQHAKSWQFLAAPAKGQTIRQSWMENGTVSPGYGILVTGPGGTAKDFDGYSPGVSIKSYNGTTNTWDPLSTPDSQVYHPLGYMVFIRGDRTVNGTTVTTPTPTILRSKGTLITGSIPAISVLPDHYQSMGNPYASPVDFTQMTRTGGVDNLFYVWDPYLTGSYGYGGYQTLSGSNNWQPVPGGTKVYPSGIACKTIQSGEAFFVHATAVTSLVPQKPAIAVNENCKQAGSTSAVNFARNAGKIAAAQRQFLRVSLYTGTSSNAQIADGNAVAFDKNFSNDIDGDDALKILNSGENFGLKRAGKTLCVEAKAPLSDADTIYYTMSHLGQQAYQLRFVPENMQANQLQAFLEDQYLNTFTQISLTDTTRVNIAVTSDPASSAADRFKVMFRQMAALPVTMVSLTATSENEGVVVKWNVENESGMRQYEVERSSDGNVLAAAATIPALNRGAVAYQWTDTHATPGNNYYRIRSIGIDGQVKYSAIVKVFTGTDVPVSVSPNPVINGVIRLQFGNHLPGNYGIILRNTLGQVVLSKELIHASGRNTEEVSTGPLTKGIYQLVITNPNGNQSVIKIVY